MTEIHLYSLNTFQYDYQFPNSTAVTFNLPLDNEVRYMTCFIYREGEDGQHEILDQTVISVDNTWTVLSIELSYFFQGLKYEIRGFNQEERRIARVGGDLDMLYNTVELQLNYSPEV